jgi:hypothetical protein
MKRLNRKIAPLKISSVRQTIKAANKWWVRDETGAIVQTLNGTLELEGFAREQGALAQDEEMTLPEYRLGAAGAEPTQAQRDFATTLTNLIDDLGEAAQAEILELAVTAAPTLAVAFAGARNNQEAA